MHNIFKLVFIVFNSLENKELKRGTNETVVRAFRSKIFKKINKYSKIYLQQRTVQFYRTETVNGYNNNQIFCINQLKL